MKPATLIALAILGLLALPLLKAPAPAPAQAATLPSSASTDIGEQLVRRAGEELIGWLFGPHGSDPSGVISLDIA